MACRGSAGSARSLELVLVLPALLLMVLVILQAAVWWHARDLVEQAAAEGARTAAAFDAGCAEGRADAARFARAASPGWVGVPRVGCTEGAEVRVTVEADALSLLPPLRVTVRAAATAPEER